MYLKLENKSWLFYLQLALYHYLHTLCTFLLQPLLLFWLRVLLLVVMIPMGIFGLIGDQIYLKGLTQQNVIKLEVARYFFPFEREILIGPAQFYFRGKIVDITTLAQYKEVLKYDPYSAQFLGVYIQLEYLYGNKNEALKSKQKLKLIAPNSNVLKRINETMKGLN